MRIMSEDAGNAVLGEFVDSREICDNENSRPRCITHNLLS
jgi:hypothetical protein